MIDWTRGYTARWRLYGVNRDTWADAGQIEGFREARVERDMTDDAPLLESGGFSLDGELADGYYRLAMVAEQDGQSERVDVSTLLCCASSGTADKGADGVEVVGRSVLWPASTRLLTHGAYAPAGVDGADFAADLLRECVHCPVTAVGGFELAQHVVFDLGASYLEAAWAVLDAGGWCMRIDGRGEVSVQPRPTEPRLELSTVNAALLQPGIGHSLDLSEVPNRYTAVDEAQVAQAVNDNPTSETSIPKRGYIIDVVDDSPDRVNGETLAAYAARRLREESTLTDERTYTREFVPDVLPYDIVRGSMPSVRLDGDMTVRSQSLACGRGIVVTEKAAREVVTWQG